MHVKVTVRALEATKSNPSNGGVGCLQKNRIT